MSKLPEPSSVTKAHDAIAVIAIVTIFQGVVAVCVNQTGPIIYRPNLLEKATIGEGCVGRKGLIASYWISGAFSSANGCRIAWNVALNDGKVYCWSVPCNNAESNQLNIERNKVRGICCCFSSLSWISTDICWFSLTLNTG